MDVDVVVVYAVGCVVVTDCVVGVGVLVVVVVVDVVVIVVVIYVVVVDVVVMNVVVGLVVVVDVFLLLLLLLLLTLGLAVEGRRLAGRCRCSPGRNGCVSASYHPGMVSASVPPKPFAQKLALLLAWTELFIKNPYNTRAIHTA